MLNRSRDEARLLERADKDQTFRSLLRSNPRLAIEQELGLRIPADVTVQVHEEAASTSCCPPPRPSRTPNSRR
jgi:hypothetical protein